MRTVIRAGLGLAAWALLTAPALAQSNWPQFRGAESRGVGADGEGLPSRWSASENVAWKTDLPGLGWSSPVVWGDRVFVTTVINQGSREEVKKGLYFGGNRPEASKDAHQWKVMCLDLNSGSIVWEQLAHEGLPPGPIHLKNTYASETPVTDGERLYVCFGGVGIFCYDLAGKPLWNHPLKALPTRFGWGTAASPVLHGDRLYYVDDNDQASYLLALDKHTGQIAWRVERADEKSNWATPYVWQNPLRTELVTPGTVKNRSYDLQGNLLWELGDNSSIMIATPYAVGDLLYLSSGYVMDKRRPIYAIRPGASGDITLPDGETSSEFIAWCQPEAGPYNPSTLVYGDRLFVLLDRGLLACYNRLTGAPIFDRQRIPDGKAFTSSPWAYDDLVFCLNEDGVTFVMRAGDQFELLHTNTLAEDDLSMATPAIVGNRLLLRTAVRLYCLQNAANQPTGGR